MATIKDFQNLINQQQLPQALILVHFQQEKLISFADELGRILFCDQHSIISDSCPLCQHWQKKQLVDVIYLGNGFNEITKTEIMQILKQLKLSALEKHGRKLYLIQNAENLKLAAANALLKFLEEPPPNTYALLLSRDRQKVLPTLRSRCQIFMVDSVLEVENDENLFANLLLSQNPEALLLGAKTLKAVPREKLLAMIEETLHFQLWKNFPHWVEPTLELLRDLKKIPSEKMVLEIYFIQLARGLNENL